MILFLEIALLKTSFAESCGFTNYSDRTIPPKIISEYERNGGFKNKIGCPLIKTDSELPDYYNEYLFGKELSNGACISGTYQKGSARYGGGPVGNNVDMVREEVTKRDGSLIWGGAAFLLPYATIYTTIKNKTIREIDDKRQTVTLDISLTMMWMDYDVYTFEPNFDGEGMTEITENEVTPENAKMIWKPDLPIYQLYDFKAFTDSLRMVRLKILSTNHLDNGLCMVGPMIRYEVDAKITFYCKFNLLNYPMDESDCKLRLGGQRPNMKFQLYDPDNSSHSDEIYDLSDLRLVVSVAEDKDVTQPQQSIGLDINIQRKLGSYVLKYYLPCIIITMVSQCSFVIPLESLPGRVALVVTQLLTLTSLFIHQMVGMILKYINLILHGLYTLILKTVKTFINCRMHLNNLSCRTNLQLLLISTNLGFIYLCRCFL